MSTANTRNGLGPPPTSSAVGSMPLLIPPGSEWSYYESFLGKCDDDTRGLLPDFLIISPPKTGTTWVADVLRRHSDVFIPLEKELHYFDWHWKSAPLTAYVRQWFAGAEGKLKGDLTPPYALLPDQAIAAIKRLKPDLKLILLPRWPPERAWSQLKHSLAHREDVFRNGPDRVADCRDGQLLMFLLSDYCRACNDYQAIIQRWMRHFDRAAIFVEYFERAISEPRAFFQKLLAFLELEPRIDLFDYPLGEAVNVGVFGAAPPWFMAAAHASTATWQRDLADDLRRQWRLAPVWSTQEEPYRGWPALICETTDGTRVEFDGTVFTAGSGKGIAAHYLGDVLVMLEQPSLRSPANGRELEDVRLSRTIDCLFDTRAVPTIEALKQRMASMDTTSVERDQRLSGLEATLEERNQRLMAIEGSLAERNRRLSALEATLKERNQRLAAIEGTLDERNQRLSALEAGLSESSQSLLSLAATLTERDRRLSALEATLAERDQRLSELEATQTERDQRLSALEATLGERSHRLSSLEATSAQWTQRSESLETKNDKS